jgi:5-methyltetrahydropteroyltriglutamate--homocysteine methyltransferase
MKIGNQDILLPTSMVGNYPNPRWYDGQAFATFPKGEFIYDTISREALEDAVLAIVHDQEMAGMDIISDGKVFGGDSAYAGFVYHYYERMTGFKMSGPNIPLPIYSTLYSPTCVGEVTREHPFHLATLRAVRKATKKPVKVSYCGVGVLAAAATDMHYKDIKKISQAIGKALNEDFKALADNGCDIIQMDEFVWPYGMGDWEIDALNTATDGVSCDVWVHTCWGNYSGTPGYAPDDKEKDVWNASVLGTRDKHAGTHRASAIFPQVNAAKVSALNYEVGRTGPDDLKPLIDNEWDRPFIAGVIDVKNTITETAEEVADRIRSVLEFVPIERLGVGTDCGLINLPRMVAQSKLRALADGAAIIRAEHAAS